LGLGHLFYRHPVFQRNAIDQDRPQDIRRSAGLFAQKNNYLLRKTIVIAPVRAPNCTAGW
jgi:hypothetical protein